MTKKGHVQRKKWDSLAPEEKKFLNDREASNQKKNPEMSEVTVSRPGGGGDLVCV